MSEPVEHPFPSPCAAEYLGGRDRVVSTNDMSAFRAQRRVAEALDSGRPSVLIDALCPAVVLMRRLRLSDKAYGMCLESLSLLESCAHHSGIATVNLLRGLCCLDIDEHERALTLIHEAADLRKKLGDKAGLAECLSAMALVHARAHDFTSARNESQAATDLLDSIGICAARSSVYWNEALMRLELGRELERVGNCIGAEAEYGRAFKALQIVHEAEPGPLSEDDFTLIDATYCAARFLPDEEAVESSLVALVACARRSSNSRHLGIAWLRLAQRHHRAGDYRRALRCGRRAVARLAQLPRDRQLVEAKRLLSQLLEYQGQLRGAYEAYVDSVSVETDQERHAVAMRAALLTQDLDAEREHMRVGQHLAYAQHLADIGRLVANVNHELNQPMASIRMMAESMLELVERRGVTEEVLESLDVMLRLSARLTELTAQFAAFPARTRFVTEHVSLRQAIDEARTMLASRLSKSPCDLVVEVDETRVQVVEGQLVRVLANLINNALDAMEGQPLGRIVFTVESHGYEHVVLEVKDNGPGIEPRILERLFQPFFSTKAAGRGLGLGLALSRDVMREMDGDLTATNAPEGGAVFRVVMKAA